MFNQFKKIMDDKKMDLNEIQPWEKTWENAINNLYIVKCINYYLSEDNASEKDMVFANI